MTLVIPRNRFGVGPRGRSGSSGSQGAAGWTPTLSVVTDSNRRIVAVTDWSGGDGGIDKPSTGYLGGAGVESDIANGTDVRGETTLYLEHRLYPVLESDFWGPNNAGFLFGSAINSGTNTTAPASGDVTMEHPGVVLYRSSTTPDSGYRYMTDNKMMRFGGGENFDFVFMTPTDMTDTTLRFGYLDATDENDAVDGAYFEMDGDFDIIGKTANNSTRTPTATLATLDADTWYHAQIAANEDASEITFNLYSDAGALLASESITTNIPTSAGREFGIGLVATNAGTSAVDLLLADYLRHASSRALVRGAGLNVGWQ